MDSVVQFIALAAIILYILGLATVNAYLDRLGASDFSLIKGRYISLGVLAAFFTVGIGLAPFLGVLITSSLISELAGKGFIALLTTLTQICVVLVLFFALPWQLVSRYLKGHMEVGRYYFYCCLLALHGGAVVIGVYFLWPQSPGSIWTSFLAEESTASKIVWVGTTLFIALYVIFAFLAIFARMLNEFASKIFPKVPAKYGGGQPTCAQLLIDEAAVTGVKHLGMSVTDDHISEVVDVLFEGANTYIVKLPSNGNVVQIAKTAVIGIQPVIPEAG